MTEAERRAWQILRSHQMKGYKFRRQVPFGRYIADLVCHEARLIVHDRSSPPKPSELGSYKTKAIAFCGFGTTRS
jgi:very-short-patch-repair endonuclease